MKIPCSAHGRINVLLMTQKVFVTHLYPVLQKRENNLTNYS